MVRLFLCFLLGSVFSQLHAEKLWNEGIIITRDGYAISGEYQNFENDYFLRNGGIGGTIYSNNIQSIVTRDYFDKMNRSSPVNASFESLWTFQTGSGYRNLEQKDIEFQNRMALSLKTLSLLATANFWNEMQVRRKRVKNSIVFLNYEAKKKSFIKSRNMFYKSLGIFILINSYYALEAFINFDRDENGERTGVYGSQEIPLSEYLEKVSYKDLQNYHIDEDYHVFSFSQTLHFDFGSGF